MMNQRITLEPAFILHRRPYRNTSLIIDLFTQHYGRITAVARSARGLQSRYRGLLHSSRYAATTRDWPRGKDLRA